MNDGRLTLVDEWHQATVEMGLTGGLGETGDRDDGAAWAVLAHLEGRLAAGGDHHDGGGLGLE